MNLTLRQLRTFVAVADCASFTAAATQLHLTQSALSVLVRELEADLGVRLLDRSTRSVRLSEAGRDFYPSVRRMLDELEGAVASITSLRDKRRGSVRIAAPQMMSCTLIPKAVAAYSRQYPDVEVKLTDTVPEQLLGRLSAGEVELAIGPDSASGPDITRMPLLRDRHLLVCPKDHPLARRRRVVWENLETYPFIAPTRDFMRALALEMARLSKSVTMRPVQEVSYMTTAIAMVSQGLGVTACPSYSAPMVSGYDLAMRPLYEPEFVREVCVFTRKGVSLSPAAESFAAFLERYVQR